jgi:hypothetical protein
MQEFIVRVSGKGGGTGEFTTTVWASSQDAARRAVEQQNPNLKAQSVKAAPTPSKK